MPIVEAVMASRLPLLLLALASAASCDDSNDMGDMSVAVPHNFKQIAGEVFVTSCSAFKSCHSAEGKSQSKLNLCSAPTPNPALCPSTSTLMDAYAALVGKTPDNKRAQAENMKLVDPCHPEKSFIITKLKLPVTETDSTVRYGAHMPMDSASLPPEQIDAISAWIARGARFDEPDDVTGTACNMPVDMSATD